MKHRTKRNLRTIFAAILAVIVIAAGGLFLISLSTSTGQTESPVVTSVPFARLEAPVTPEAPPQMNLDGGWTFKTDKGGIFDATVKDRTIKIVMKAPNGTSMLYWNGTFETYASAGAVIVSKTIDDKAALSQSSTKNFTVGEKTLSFSFTMQGVTKVVDLRRA